MLKSITAKSITAIAAAAAAASLAVFLTSAVPEAKAASHVRGEQPLAKGDRLSALARGAACSSRSWPYYDQNCRFDLRKPAKEAPAVRIIALRSAPVR
jgi:hypothetical protein